MNSKKNSKIMSNVSDRDKALLFLLLSILFLAFSYFFVFKGYIEKAEQVRSENDQLTMYLAELDAKIAKQDEISAEIKQYDEERQSVLTRFSGGYTVEKANDVLADMEEETGLFCNSVAFSMNAMYFNQQELEAAGAIERENLLSNSSFAIQGVSQEDYSKLVGYETDLTVGFGITAENYAKLVEYINSQEEKIFVKSITVGPDESTGDLSGTMVIAMYSADGIDKAYEEPDDVEVSTGVTDIYSAKKITKGKKKE